MLHNKISLFLTLFLTSFFFSVQSYPAEKGLTDKAADYICLKAKEGKKTRLAVYPFTTKDGSTSADTEVYATKIIEVILTKGEFRIIDPAKVSKIVEEQEKGLSGLVDPDTAPETGKMLGADAMIFGITGDGIIQVRIVDAVTGEVLGATVTDTGNSAKINSEDFNSDEDKKRFLTEQMESNLGQLYMKHPGMFLYVTANDAEMKELEAGFPRITRDIRERLKDKDDKKGWRFENRKKKLLKIRRENPSFDHNIRGMREKAIAEMKSKKKRN